MSERMIVDDVRDQYAGVARGGLSNDSTAVRSIASAFGYSEADLNQLPAEANMGLSCGNPLALLVFVKAKSWWTWAAAAGWMCFSRLAKSEQRAE